MRLVCISDTHMAHRQLRLPDGDVLIHAGDATHIGTLEEVARFLEWLEAQPHRHKLFIAGNHDFLFQRHPEEARNLLARYPTLTYLQDSGTVIEGVRFWGAPWQPWFFDWAFNLPRGGARLREAWNRVPLDTEVLITHGPPHGVLDQVHGQEHLGCEELRIRLAAVRPRLHVFGHIHAAYGVAQSPHTVYANASACTEAYQALNRPIVVDLAPGKTQVQGLEASSRRQRLESLQALVAVPQSMVPWEGKAWIPGQILEALDGLAELRGLDRAGLVTDYLRRGVQADLAKLRRAEGRPAHRPIPFTRLEEA